MRDRGLALIAVLFAIVIVTLWVTGSRVQLRVEARALDRARWERRQREAMEAGFVGLEVELRRVLSGERVPTGDDLRVVLSSPSIPGFEVTGEVEPLPELGPVSTVARRPEDGLLTRVMVNAFALGGLDRTELEGLLDAHGAGSRVEGLAHALDSLRLDPGAVQGWNALLSRWRSVLADLPALLRQRLEVALDPHPRLRRTGVHPERMRGKDRGRFAAGPCLSPFPPRRHRLRVRVVGEWAGEERVLEREREVDLLRSIEVMTQARLLDRTAFQVHGGVLGPEPVADFDWTRLPVETVSVDPEETWSPREGDLWNRGASIAGRSVGPGRFEVVRPPRELDLLGAPLLDPAGGFHLAGHRPAPPP